MREGRRSVVWIGVYRSFLAALAREIFRSLRAMILIKLETQGGAHKARLTWAILFHAFSVKDYEPNPRFFISASTFGSRPRKFR
jgi:hypothetical protein